MSADLDFSVKIESNLAEIEKGVENAIERALYAMGVLAVDGAVTAISSGETQAVDTGRLRASLSFITAGGQSGESGQKSNASKAGDTITGKADEKSVIVGTNVNYAEFVHNGTSRMGARPFLRVGIENKREEMKETVEEIFKGEL